jgi:malonate-semialdehyde dehydrogenase (acetylating)/methylmalonate-semialdehyde dehydrogenase
VLLDGSDVRVDGYESGNFIGPTVLSGVRVDMECYTEEIFGPVLVCLEVASLDEALDVINANEHGNGTAIFTSSGYAAKEFQSRVNVGMVGVNVPIPVPSGAAGGFSFTGWNGSFHGDLAMYGSEGVKFYTRTKTVTAAWRETSAGAGPAAHAMPGLAGVGT